MRKILVVDDEFDIAEAISAILRADGFEVATCSNGKDAIEYLQSQSQQPCLVILDIMMPFVSGYEVLRFMKGNGPTKTIPVIVMSAASPTGRQKDFGWSAFLKKPFSLDALENLIVALVRREDAISLPATDSGGSEASRA